MVDTSNVIRSGPKVTRPNLTNATSEKQIDTYFDLANPKAKWLNIKIIGVALMNSILIAIKFTYIEDPVWMIVGAIVACTLIIAALILLLKKNSGYRFLTYCLDIYGILAAVTIFDPIVIIPVIITIIFIIDIFSVDFALQPQGIANRNMETDERVE